LKPSGLADLLKTQPGQKKEGDILKKFAAAVVLGCALIATSIAGATTGRAGSGARIAATPPPIVWGVADDASKFADDGGAWFYGEMKGANLSTNRWTLAWDSTAPTAIKELAFLQRAAPKAQAAGVHVLLALYAGTPSPTATQHDPTQFCAWAAQVATLAKGWGIHDFIVWNEPNTRLYWSPQKDASGNDVAAPAYEALLAQCYDTIHAADSAANVIGMGLSPRASTSESTEPLVFLRDVGKAYKASGRTAPIMDQLSVHPYPNPNAPADSPDVGYEVLDRYGIPNMDRVKQAVYDGFNGTGQPTTVSANKPLTFVVDEIGWQTDTTSYSQYVNAENVATISEQTQAAFIKKMAEKYFACDPTVVSVQLFLLADEKYRNGKDANGVTLGGGWQSGLLTAGGSGISAHKSAYSQVSSDFAAGRGACSGSMISWTPQGAGGDSGGSTGTGSTSATLGDPNGLLGPASLAGLQKAFDQMNAFTAFFSGLQIQIGSLISPLQTQLNVLLAPIKSEDGTTLTLNGVVYSCAGTCTANDVLGAYWAAAGGSRSVSAARGKLTKVATFASSVTATKKTSATLKPVLKKSAKAPVGTYFLVGVLKSKADPSLKYGFAVKTKSVKAATKPKKK
jgi:hypothetical protein